MKNLPVVPPDKQRHLVGRCADGFVLMISHFQRQQSEMPHLNLWASVGATIMKHLFTNW